VWESWTEGDQCLLEDLTFALGYYRALFSMFPRWQVLNAEATG